MFDTLKSATFIFVTLLSISAFGSISLVKAQTTQISNASKLDLSLATSDPIRFNSAAVTRMRRLAATWLRQKAIPEALGKRWEYGPDPKTMRRLMVKLSGKYNPQDLADRMNAIGSFKAESDGVTLNFLAKEGAIAESPVVVLLHGWPHNYTAFLGVVDRLVHPENYGGNTEDSVAVIVPSYPNYPNSERKLPPPGPRTIAKLINKLMIDVLGVDRYYIQGGDWGSYIAVLMALENPKAVAGIHLNHVFMRQPADALQLEATSREGDFSDEERDFFARESAALSGNALAYFFQQAVRPQTLGYMIAGDPAATLAWYLDKYYLWSDKKGQRFDAGWSDQEILDQIAIMLLTGSEETATWIYRGFANEPPPVLAEGQRVQTPTAFAAFPDEFTPPPPKSIVARSYNLVRYTTFEVGGHFPMLENPEAYVADVLSFIKSVEAAAH